nr:hypothetical protein [Tanacetum cinerariifolium]
EDLEVLWKLVKERFASSKPKNFSNDFLLTTLTYMFEKPNVQDQVWKNQRTDHDLEKSEDIHLQETEPTVEDKADDDEIADFEIKSLGHAIEEHDRDIYEGLYDTKSEIRFTKRFSLLIKAKEPKIIPLDIEVSAMDEDSDVGFIHDDEIGSSFETSATNEKYSESQHIELTKTKEMDVDNVIDELTELKASADKPS